MRRTPYRPGPRAGFTLVELLVVITILAILFALTAAAVVKVLGKGDEVKVRNEISQLANAVQAFKTQYGISYIPDRIILPPGYDTSLATQQYLTSVWPRIYAPQGDIGTLSASSNQFTKNGAPYLLNGVAYTPFTYWGITTGTTPVVLHGDQCLVFFLGGKIQSGIPIGWSTDATDPMRLTGSRHGPFYDSFTPDRLAVLAGPGATPEVAGLPKRSSFHPSFKDIFGSAPYLYFSAAKAGNDYANAIAAPAPPGVTPPWMAVSPYRLNNSPRYMNASAFQIISAGKDTAFGTGGINWPGGGGSTTADGYDDVANFHPTLLGIANN